MSSHRTVVQDDHAITATEADFLAEVNQQESALLRLPRELRDIIYGYALGGNQIRYSPSVPSFGPGMPPIGNFEVFVPDRWGNTFYGPMPMTTLLSLQNTSRQLHDEIGNLVFKINTFDISELNGWNMLWALPLNGRNAVRTVRLIVPNDGPIFSFGFHSRCAARFITLSRLPALQKIEGGFQFGPGLSSQNMGWLGAVIKYMTGIGAKVVPSYSQYCMTATPLESAARHGTEKGVWAMPLGLSGGTMR